VQLAAAIATDRDQVHVLRVRADVQFPGTAQHDVDHACPITHERIDRFVVGEALLECRVAFAQRLAERCDRIRRRFQRDGQRVEEGPGGGCGLGRTGVQRVDRDDRRAHAGGCSWAPSVSTS
jgi:hypothetical protein